jgi:hypothetical protein
VFSLYVLLERYSIGELSLMVIDCEGAEWDFLDTPSIGRIKAIVGEYHAGLPNIPNWVPDAGARMVNLLSKTHSVVLTNPLDTLVGHFEARHL